MRLRRLSAVFWATCIAVLLFILYVVTDLSFKLPSVKPFQEAHETPWNSFEKKLHNIEKELTHHEAVVEEIRSAVNHIVEQSQELEVLKNPNEVSARKSSQGSSKSPSKLCPIELMGVSPVTQMLQLYENTSFLDVDGGVWKQGWSIEYDQRQWDTETKLKVFIIPHSHNDPGWLKTFEDYYKTQTRSIFKNMVEKLPAESERKFIWAETSYLSLWWNDATTKQKAAFESLLRSGHIEIVTGGWVMNDEANTHWLSVIQQLTVGHQWLIDHLGYIPKNAWAIDPFGHSSAQPYLLKLAGFENSVIQRVHYIVKKELALQKSLEFRWRQTWDGSGATELFTHMMPFYSYDVPHSCGPDPKICCQFDFRRLPGFGLNCPWNVPPKKITPKNVHERASLILDQWRKKSQLYKTNVIFFPLGDDFRYDQANEWDEQYKNYEAIINYINAKDEFHAEVQFGTLKDYFKAVHAELPITKFPSVAGDFFTYADRNQHYWSGYYTTRPFYKNMDRALLAYVRAAEIITGQAVSSQKVTAIVALQLRDKLVLARQALALFQHHDGITGTARNEVRADYAHKMIAAIHYCQTTIQQAAYYLLNQPKLQEHEREDIYFHIDDEWFQHDKLSSTGTIVMDSITSRRNLFFYNPLMFKRTEVVTIIVNTPKIQITDSTGTPIPIQISPVIGGVKLWLVAEKFKISFVAHIDAMSIATYVIKMINESNRVATYSSLRIYNAPQIKENAHKMFEIEEAGQHKGDISLGQNDMMVTLDEQGMLKLVRTEDGTVIPIKLDYITYSSRTEQDNNSGAYLFMPKGEGEVLPPVVGPAILVIQGDYVTSVHVEVDSTLVGNMIVTIRLINNPSLPQTEIEISNTFLIDQTDDAELAMRFTTDILNSEVFYTDVNGMQMTKRKHFSKLPIQANYYPMPAAAYIEDKDLRLTVLTSTPLGVASLQDGQIEIMQDRRLRKDDNRGLNQPILDNIWTRHTFKLIVEKNIPCQSSLLSSHSGSGFLTLGAHVSQQMLLQPLIKMHYATQEKSVPVLKKRKNPVNAADLVLASFNSHISAKTKDERKVQGMGLTFQRVHLTSCYGESNQIQSYYPVSNGQFRISDIADLASDQVYESTLTYVTIKEPLAQGILNICPMQIRSVFVNQTLKHT